MPFNDSTFLGWLTTGMYVATATLCAIAAAWPTRSLSARQDVRKRLAFFWSLLAMMLLLLAINKQMDLQTTLTDALRDMAERGGWYARRRMWQFIFVIVAACGLVATVWAIRRLLGREWRNQRLALAGVVLVAGFLLMRVVDIERVGETLNLPSIGRVARSIVEWAGLLCIAGGAWRHAVGWDGRSAQTAAN